MTRAASPSSMSSPNSLTSPDEFPAPTRRGAIWEIVEVKAVVDLLRRHLRPEAARLWIRSPNPDLGYEKPLDLIARGEYLKVIGAVLAMAEGLTA